MKKLYLLIILLTVFFGQAQYITIPNVNWPNRKDLTARFSEFSSVTAATISPPKITASGNQIYCPGTSLNIVETVNITFDPLESTTDGVYIQISSGYVLGQDQLILTGFHPSISANWNSTEGKLVLKSNTGNKIPYSDFVSAIKDVQFINSNISPSGIRTFSITLGTGNVSYLPSNGHYYEYVPNLGINWTRARDLAALSNFYGLQGYLATLTAGDEAQLAGAQAPGAGWIGGSDSQTEGTWKWVTGPEGLANGGTGTIFWIGKSNGAPTPPHNYANWNTSGNEPNDSRDNEDYAHITAPALGYPGTWNDLPEPGDPITNTNYYPQGYIVEYGGMDGDPTSIQISASTSITIPKITSVTPNSTCVSGSLLLQATATDGTVDWYDSPRGGNLLGTGNSFTTPNLTTTTSYYVDASNGSCSNGPRTEIIATVNIPPTITSALPASRCGIGTVTLRATASEGIINWFDDLTGGNLVGTGDSFTTPPIITTTIYYIESNLSGCITPIRTPITATINTYPIITTTTPGSRCDSGVVTIAATASGGTINWYDVATGGTPLGNGNSFTTPNVTSTTNFYAETTENECTSIRVAITATVYPIIPLKKEILLCQSETLILEASIPDMEYLWSPGGETTQSIEISNIGDYKVIISSPSGSCDSKEEFKVIEHPKPIIKEIVMEENSITIELENPKDYYEFSIDGELFKESNQFTQIPSGQYTAFVREKNGCNLIQLNFDVFSIAKYFTPNNDGFNDFWEIKEMKDFPNSTASIFDRYGKLIAKLTPLQPNWNGNYDNTPLIEDDYWYVLKMEDSKPSIKGHFSLKR